MCRLIKELLQPFSRSNVSHFTRDALEAIRCAAEDYLVSMFEKATLCTLHRKAVTLKVIDMELAGKLTTADSNYNGICRDGYSQFNNGLPPTIIPGGRKVNRKVLPIKTKRANSTEEYALEL